MNKKIKSGSEIKQEISDIFKTYKNVDDLIERIKIFLNNITGKELLDRNKIDLILCSEIFKNDYFKDSLLSNNKKFIKAFNDLNPNNRYLKMFGLTKPNIFLKQKISDIPLIATFPAFRFDAIPLDIIFTCKEFEKYRELEMHPADAYEKIFVENKDFAKLFFFFKKYPSVSKILEQYAYELKQKFLVELVIKKIVPLNSIFIYFDMDKNHKENTEDFFIMLKKKIPRNTIQAAITRDLKRIVSGEFYSCL